MPYLAKHSECTGCGACQNACNRNAISMSPIGALGHVFPIVNTEVCVECGLCSKTCPVITPPPLHNVTKSYVAWAKDWEDNKKSTSGGAATSMTRLILKSGGIVYGCSSNGLEIKHTRITGEDDIELLRGSKYVQSAIGNTYKDVKRDLNNGSIVLFIGTPCQAAGLRAFLRKEYDNLYIIDLICHGTPSQKLLKDHIQTIVGSTKNIKKVSFRQGTSYILTITGENNECLYSTNLWKERYKDAYYTSFIQGYTFRDSCGICSYAQPSRVSDLTIGDFWGLGKIDSFTPIAPAFGYSVLLPNTSKGEKMVKQLEKLMYIQERNIQEAIAGNDQLRHPKRKTIGAHYFQWLMKKGFSLRKALTLTDFHKILIYKIINFIEKK